MTTTTATPLALHGGPKAKTVPYGKGQRFGAEELELLREALDQNTLFYGFGKFVKQACEMMKAYTGMPYVVPTSSGSAAVHLGLIAAGVGPGDEVITTPNTDTGTVLGIIEEGAVPVFCDPELNMQPSARAIEACITPRTRAVVVVHLAGMPAPMDEIVALCAKRGIGIIEDCAQSWGTKLNGRMVGSFGDAGCYSTNDFKHISTGDGGFVALRDEKIYRRVSNYADKHYDRLFDRSLMRAHHAVNYRMTELQGAVAVAQLRKVDQITARHHELGERLRQKLAGLQGVRMLDAIPGGYATYWWIALFLDLDRLTTSRDEIVSAIAAEGVSCGSMGQYDLIQAKIFQERVARPWLNDERRFYPFKQPDGRDYTYTLDATPRHKRMIETGLMVSIDKFHTDLDIDEAAHGVTKVLSHFLRR